MPSLVGEDAEAIALARIEESYKTRGVTLNLRGLKLTQLPPTIEKIKSSLLFLDVAENKLTEFPEIILYMYKLEDLYIDQNNLTQIPTKIGKLVHLETLSLSNNSLTSLPPTLSRLKRLRTLSLWSNKMRKLPQCIIQLRSLKHLDLWDNKISELPAAIGELHQLESLELGFNPLTTLPESFLRLTNLQRLDLSDTEIRKLPPVVLQLRRLITLDLSNNGLTELPEGLRMLTQLKELHLHSNESLNLPREILGSRSHETSPENPPVAAERILEYYFRTRGAPRPLNEAKLVLVGFGGVGKTSLVRRLINDQFDQHEPKTEGIDINVWPVRVGGTENVRLHVWDFGGQEIMHATHQFFLTQRSLYLLVLSGRQGREDADAEYWLNLITGFAPDSPVIIVLNKIKEHNFDVNRTALRQKFSQIYRFIVTDCRDRTGLDDLSSLILQQTDRLPHLRDEFPSAWFAIKDHLASMKENYLTFDGYRELCRENGESDAGAQETLAGFLHSLGIALNYKDDPRLRDTHVLNPRWVTEGVYTIINSERLAQQKGELYSSDLQHILDVKQYPPERHDFLLELMRKFELCFRFPEEDDHYLVPELLSKEEPTAAEGFNLAACLNFEYHYPAMLPEGLMPRFIVRTYVLSRDEPRWRFGVIVKLEKNRALVVGDPIERRVRITISGPVSARRSLLAVIRSDFERIHESYAFQPTEMIPVPHYPGVLVSYRELVVFENSGISSIPRVSEDRVLNIGVRELLDGVDIEGTRMSVERTHRAERGRRAFISFSHRDDTLRAELETHLKLLNREGLLDLWSDRRIPPGSEWGQQIDSNLERADVVLLLISSDFIASDYCYSKEMGRALEKHEAGTASVVPIIVRDVDWHPAPFAKLQALPKDGKAVAARGRSRLARDAAWKEVAEGIRRVLTPISG